MEINIYVVAVIAFATLCLGHIIGYKTRKKDEVDKPITILVKPESLEFLAEAMNDNVVVVLDGRGKIAEVRLGEFKPKSELTKIKKSDRD